ncbi:hypothetical protein PLESTB_001690300 [Pleodorina starrii]|uniref:Uncharacterized protein n=1 Tax=Pleodorina starrii TaxID=330485 RepID=A0A9W6BYI1_9CHLO|nr:hypothetical protein PLESTM_001663300 [Pleodorina starrii]GLC60911.1 hypothetical protein PLESTB_001690300 [Pleodorina starrii]
MAFRVLVPEVCRQRILPTGKLTLSDLSPPYALNGRDTYWLPRDRLDDLKAGEGDRGDCSFVVCHHEKPPMPKRVQHNSVEEFFDLQCCFGPADNRDKAELQPVVLARGKPEERQQRINVVAEACHCTVCDDMYIPGMGCKCGGPEPLADQDAQSVLSAELGDQRRSKLKAGESIKVGCQFSMRVHFYRACPDWACVRVKQQEHVDKAGKPCHGACCPEVAGTRLARAAHLSPTTRDWVRDQLLSGVPVGRIVQENRAQHIRRIQVEHGCSEVEVQAVLAFRPPRDLFLSTADVTCYSVWGFLGPF